MSTHVICVLETSKSLIIKIIGAQGRGTEFVCFHRLSRHRNTHRALLSVTERYFVVFRFLNFRDDMNRPRIDIDVSHSDTQLLLNIR